MIGEAHIAEVVDPGPGTLGQLVSGDYHHPRMKTGGPSCWRDYHFRLANNHDVFSLQEGERGETFLVTMEIDAADAPPQKQPSRRMSFMVREEVVIQPSNSQWTSPVVMVRKRDGSQRFCFELPGTEFSYHS